MPTFLITSITNNGVQVRPVVAADLATLEAAIQARVTAQLATGLPLYLGSKALAGFGIQDLGGNSGQADGEVIYSIGAVTAVGKLAVGGTNITWT